MTGRGVILQFGWVLAGCLTCGPVFANHPCSNTGVACIPHPQPEPLVVSVPEPASAVLFAVGVAAFGLRRPIPVERGS